MRISMEPIRIDMGWLDGLGWEKMPVRLMAEELDEGTEEEEEEEEGRSARDRHVFVFEFLGKNARR